MKTTIITTLFTTIFYLFSTNVSAQDGYTYTILDNGSYSYTIAAVPNASANTFATSVQSYGFTIVVPDGVTATITSSLGNSASAVFFDGNAIGQPTLDGYLITETLASPATLTAPVAATPSAMVSIQVNGSPTSGTMYILENNSTLATTITALKSFMAADMIDDGMALFPNVVNPNGTGVSGTSSINFATLSVTQNELLDVAIYPNPAKDIVNIMSPENTIIKVEIVDLH